MRVTIKDLLLGTVLVLRADAMLAASVVTKPAGRPGFPRGFGRYPRGLLTGATAFGDPDHLKEDVKCSLA